VTDLTCYKNRINIRTETLIYERVKGDVLKTNHIKYTILREIMRWWWHLNTLLNKKKLI